MVGDPHTRISTCKGQSHENYYEPVFSSSMSMVGDPHNRMSTCKGQSHENYYEPVFS